MWKKLPYHLPYYILYTEKKSKANSDEKLYDILVTNYFEIWYLFHSKSSLLETLRECNKRLEISEETLLQRGIDMMLKPDELKNVKIDAIEREILDVTLTKFYGFPLRLKLTMVKGSHNLFYDTVILPLLKTVNVLKSSQDELCKLLKKKDKEIEEYKCEGGEIALRHLKTVPFNEENHLSKYNVLEDYFETFDSKLLENKLSTTKSYFRTRGVGENNISVKSEPSDGSTSGTQDRGGNQNNFYVKTETVDSSTSSTQNEGVFMNNICVKLEPSDGSTSGTQDRAVHENNISVKFEPLDSNTSSSQNGHSIVVTTTIKEEPMESNSTIDTMTQPDSNKAPSTVPAVKLKSKMKDENNGDSTSSAATEIKIEGNTVSQTNLKIAKRRKVLNL